MTKREYLGHVVSVLEAARQRLVAAEGEPLAERLHRDEAPHLRDVYKALRLHRDEALHLRDVYKALLHSHSHTLMEAAGALLAATEPASDEEIGSARTDLSGGWLATVRTWRAAEAHVRRLAFGEEEG